MRLKLLNRQRHWLEKLGGGSWKFSASGKTCPCFLEVTNPEPWVIKPKTINRFGYWAKNLQKGCLFKKWCCHERGAFSCHHDPRQVSTCCMSPSPNRINTYNTLFCGYRQQMSMTGRKLSRWWEFSTHSLNRPIRSGTISIGSLDRP